MTIQITSFDELVEFIEFNDLTTEQFNALIIHTLGIWSFKEELELPKAELIHKLKRYWERWATHAERPIFLSN